MSRLPARIHDLASDVRSWSESLRGQGPLWLQHRRRGGLRQFEREGLPTTRVEEWRNTNVTPLARIPFRPADPDPGDFHADLARRPMAGVTPIRLVMVDGRPVATEGPLPVGVTAGSFSELAASEPARLEELLGRIASADGHPFTALSSALLDDGFGILLEAGADVATPIHVVNVTRDTAGPVMTCPRVLIVAADGSRATVLESHLGGSGAPHLTNAVTEIWAGSHVDLHHVRVQDEHHEGYHVGRVATRQGRDSRVSTVSVTLGAALTRLDVDAVVDGEGAEAELLGLYVLDGERHVDHHTVLDHARPHGSSNELYKGILAGSSRAVFNGRILVRADSQKTDAKQSNPNLLLSDDATIHTRPQLEIYADDVKCTHGATVGRLDPDALFYLRSRGIDPVQGRDLLIHAFAGDVLDRIDVDGVRELLRRQIQDVLGRVRDGGGNR
jgi:Fe-S cluster assembly protein SufD